MRALVRRPLAEVVRREIRNHRCFSTQPAFKHEPLFQSHPHQPMRLLTSDYVSEIEVAGKKVLKVEPEALRLLASTAMVDIAHLLRPGHLQQLANILSDPEATSNDRFVALQLLKNANVAAGKVLPGCQDTGTAIVKGERGQYVWTDGNDEASLSQGVYDTYTGTNSCIWRLATRTMHLRMTGTGTTTSSSVTVAPPAIVRMAHGTSPHLSSGTPISATPVTPSSSKIICSISAG
jgi:fumarate hydratase class I